MSSDTQPATSPKWMLWVGWILTILESLALIMSAVFKFIQPGDFAKGFSDMGWPVELAIVLGITELACALLYLFPRTAVLGAILLTGYLGGAIATHVRIHDDFIAPIIFGVLIWLGIYFRDARLRAIVPWRS